MEVPVQVISFTKTGAIEKIIMANDSKGQWKFSAVRSPQLCKGRATSQNCVLTFVQVVFQVRALVLEEIN
jgi:hypothetical protein